MTTTTQNPRGPGPGPAAKTLERDIQQAIRLAVGKLPDVVLFRNSAGVATMTDGQGRDRTQRFGLAVGMPDLVGVLAPAGRWVALEVKRPGQKPRPEQVTCHELLRRFGAFVAVVTSVDEALAALERARAGALS